MNLVYTEWMQGLHRTKVTVIQTFDGSFDARSNSLKDMFTEDSSVAKASLLLHESVAVKSQFSDLINVSMSMQAVRACDFHASVELYFQAKKYCDESRNYVIGHPSKEFLDSFKYAFDKMAEYKIPERAGCLSIEGIDDYPREYGPLLGTFFTDFYAQCHELVKVSSGIAIGESSYSSMRHNVKSDTSLSDKSVAGKSAVLSHELLMTLPGLHSASFSEVLDIRKELAPYRTRFNAKLIEFSREIKSEVWSDGFVKEADLLYQEKVLPALQDIDDALKSDNAIGRFLSALNVANPGGGTVLAVGLMSVLASNPFVQAAGASIAVTGAALNAYKENLKAKQERESNAMFFLHKARERLS